MNILIERCINPEYFGIRFQDLNLKDMNTNLFREKIEKVVCVEGIKSFSIDKAYPRIVVEKDSREIKDLSLIKILKKNLKKHFGYFSNIKYLELKAIDYL